MTSGDKSGWHRLVGGRPWFAGEGRYALAAYSEFMPPPRVGQTAYGELDASLFAGDDPYGWRISEQEQEYELDPGLESIARQIMGQLVELGSGRRAVHIGGHNGRNLEGNPYWSPDLAAHAGRLHHERYVILLPLALSRTQDDMGRVRWTLFGSSSEGPEKAFWKSFYSGPDQERPERECLSWIIRLLAAAYGEKVKDARGLSQIGFRILASEKNEAFPGWHVEPLPKWTRRYVVDDQANWDDVRFLLTFRAYSRLPAQVKANYLTGRLALLPFPGSLVFWGVPAYIELVSQMPLAMQLPLLRLVARRGGPEGIRVPQSGWLHEPRRDGQAAQIETELLMNTYKRTNRWQAVSRDQDEVAASTRVDRVLKAIFSTDLDSLDLYDKPEARNSQLWTEEGEVLLDGPNAGRKEIRRAAERTEEGGIFRYRFQFPPMRVGRHEVYWQRPLAAYLSRRTGELEMLTEPPLGYLTAHLTGSDGHTDPADTVELYPRCLQRKEYLTALRDLDSLARRSQSATTPGRAPHDHYKHETPLNVVALLDHWQLWGERPLPRSLAQQLLRRRKQESLDTWMRSITRRRGSARRLTRELKERIEASEEPPPPSLTFDRTATREFETAFWEDLKTLSQGSYLNKDNADCVRDTVTQEHLAHRQRDLGPLGAYILGRHRRAIAEAGMDGRAVAGELPFRWRTDFDFRFFGGWEENYEGREYERDLLVVIPGKRRGQVVVMADHYDTAYCEDIFYKSRGGSGARLAAPGADDNCSATATLLLAAPIFLNLAREGRLERDVWLLHLTGEEFPADCLGARYFCEALVERTLKLKLGVEESMDLNSRVAGVCLMDMIAHNRDDAQDIFQISPGRGAASFRLAYQAHLANRSWNAQAVEGNRSPERRGMGRGRRSADGKTIPAIARFPQLDGEVRTIDDPSSSLYNTDGQIFSDTGVPVVLFMENYDINRTGYHDTKDTMQNIDLDYGAALSAIVIETVARSACQGSD